MKTKILKNIMIILAISIVIELGIVFYNFVINKIFYMVHLIGNEHIEIAKEDTQIINQNGFIDIKVDNVNTRVYNISLLTNNGNDNIYLRVLMNNGEKFVPKENAEGTKFKVYFLRGTEVPEKTFKLTYPATQLNIDNIKSIVINDNLDYVPQVRFSFIQFLIIFVIILIIYGLVTLFKEIKNKNLKIKKEYIFLAIASTIGLTFIFINPPQVKYDEHAHFWRAYEISQGNIISKVTNELPVSLTEFLTREDGTYPNREMKYNDMIKNLGRRLNKDEKSKFAVGASGSLTPVSYLPQLVGTIIGKIANASPVIILWLGRMTNLLAYIIVIFFAIRLMPLQKWKIIIMMIALFPMSLNLAATYSPDAVIIGFSMLAISYAMYLKFEKQKIDIKETLLFGILCMIPTVCKIVYFPLFLLFLTIPKEKFESKKIKIKYVLICMAIVFIPYLILNVIIHKGSYEIAIRTNSTEQVIFTISDLARDFTTAINTLYNKSSTYLFEMIGGFNTINIISIIILIMILLATFNNIGTNNKYELTIKDKIIFSIIILIETLGIFAAMYLGWTQGKQTIVEGVQGRYFLPTIPIVLMAISSSKLEINIKNKSIKYACIMAIMYISIVIYTIKLYV